jgi:hypothetical protein
MVKVKVKEEDLQEKMEDLKENSLQVLKKTKINYKKS